jgi:hypothetical protein
VWHFFNGGAALDGLDGLVRAVQETGFGGPWCVEVNTPESRALPVEAAAKAAADAAMAVLDAARR